MILLIVCMFIGGYIFYKKVADRGSKIEGLLSAMAGMAAGCVIAMMLMLFYTHALPHEVERYEFDKANLVALGDANELQGSFFLGTGSVGSEQYYKFYYALPDGGKKFGKLNAESVTVYEEDREDAYIVKVGERKIYSSQASWLVPKLFLEETKWGKWSIHVPKGTIKVGYNLDLK